MVGDRRNLPLWAQQELSRLKLQVESLQQTLAKVADTGDSKIVAQANSTEIGLPDRAVVHYKLAMGRIDVRLDNDELLVYAISDRGDRFIMAPGASNVVHLRFVEPPVMK
jgi:hypothetical protein